MLPTDSGVNSNLGPVPHSMEAKQWFGKAGNDEQPEGG